MIRRHAVKKEGQKQRVGTKRPVAVDKILRAVLKDKGIDQQLARYQFVLKWPEIVGAEIARRTKPECLRNGALVVRVCNSVWAQELSFYKPVILNRLKRHLPDSEFVRDVVFYVSG